MADEPALQLGFGPIRHTRLRPVVRSFTYPGVFLRLRMDGEHLARAVRPLGRWFGLERAAPIGFRAADHGDGCTPLVDWIRGLCLQAGIAADGPVWLHCLPRLFGYAFKPVSFWFCHGADGTLRAVVAEVNNTFGERHCYLLAQPDGSALRDGVELGARKVFHVSPFCTLEGGYRFRFVNRPHRALARVDYHDTEGPLLLTSLSGELHAATPASLRRAVFRHPTFAVGVVARIHLQAWRLWRARVPFHSKPAAPEAFVTRGYR